MWNPFARIMRPRMSAWPPPVHFDERTELKSLKRKLKDARTGARESRRADDFRREHDYLREQLAILNSVVLLRPTQLRKWLSIISVSEKLELPVDEQQDTLLMVAAKFPDERELDAPLQRMLGRLDFTARLALLERAHASIPGQYFVAAELARISFEEGDLAAAEVHCERILESHGDRAEIQELLLAILAARSDWRHIETICLSWLDKDPERLIVLNALGSAAIEILRGCMQESVPGTAQKSAISSDARAGFIEDPWEALAPWRQSLCYRELEANALVSAGQDSPRGASATEKETKILFLTQGNTHFLDGVVDWFSDRAQVNVRTLRIWDPAAGDRIKPTEVVGRVVAGARRRRLSPNAVRTPIEVPDVSWADVVFVEWCDLAAVWLTGIVEFSAKVVVRLHSYEAYSVWPHLVNWGRVGTLITVGAHVRELVHEEINLEPYGLRSLTLPNYNDLARYALPKSDRGYKTLGLVGYNNENKNPRQALEILSGLDAIDHSWKLLLVGSPWPEDFSSAAEREYFREFQAYMAENNLQDCVEYRGFSDRLESEFQEIDYILSTSEREGTHETVIQGMASGAIPIVRNWPISKKWGGARQIYDGDFVYETVPEAISQIHEIEDSGRRTELSQFAANLAESEFGYQTVMPRMELAVFS